MQDKVFPLIHRVIAALGCIYCGFLILPGCKTPTYSHLPAYQFTSSNGQPDYSSLNYWAAHPWKKDPSDSVPKSLRNKGYTDSLVDVFFLHPTTLTDKKDKRMTAAIDDAELNAKTDYSSILYQASVFNQNCRVFAPRYRQAHYRCFFESGPAADSAFEIAYADIKKAFTHYLQHYNNGRPIIIAAHSQGTKHAARLLQEFFDEKLLQNKLVCAYLPGLPVPVTYFKNIPACKDPDATGCVVSWRTYKKGYIEPLFVAKENYNSIVVNPLTWRLDTLFAPSSMNTGGILQKFNKLKPGVVNAQVYQNVLWTSKPRFFGTFLLRSKNYHIGDINLFYNNIRQNVQHRIGAFWKR
jgi:hypothetical protein